MYNQVTERVNRGTLKETSNVKLDMNTSTKHEDDFCNFDDSSPHKQEFELSKLSSDVDQKVISIAPN